MGLGLIVNAIKDAYPGLGKQGGEQSLRWLMFFALWLTGQAWLSAYGIYWNTEISPPFMVYPTILALLFAIIMALAPLRSMRHIPLDTLMSLHALRAINELVMWWLYGQELMPKELTFVGRNYDVIIGITAPFIAWLCFSGRLIHRNWALIWNLVGIASLLNLLLMAVLSIKTPFQQMGFEIPNEAAVYFPFIWLPTFMIPLWLFAHIIAIKRLVIPDRASHPEDMSEEPL
jgi:hypothetical protein